MGEYGNYIVGIILFMIIAYICYYLYKNNKNGSSSCGCGCGSCGGSCKH